MKIRRIFVLTVLAATILIAGKFVGGELLAIHVRSVTGRAEVGNFRCWNCHFVDGSIAYQKGKSHPDPFFLATNATGETVFVSEGPVRKVARINVTTAEVRLSAELEGQPRGLGLSPDEQTLAVSLAGADVVVLLDPENLRVLRTFPVGSGPTGLAFSAAGSLLVVANGESSDISVISLQNAKERLRLRAGREPFAVVAAPDGSQVAVVSRMAEVGDPSLPPRSEITLLDGTTGQVNRRIHLESCHMSEGAIFTPDSRYLLVPALRTRNLLPIVQVARGWVMSSVIAVIDTHTGTSTLLPLMDPSQGFPDPSGIALDTEQGWLWIAAGGSNEVGRFHLDRLLMAAAKTAPGAPENLSLTQEYSLGRFSVGRNPRGLVVTKEGLTVAERLDDTIGIYSNAGLVRRIPVGSPVPFDEIRHGDAVFHDARYAFQKSFSCRSCHPGGHTDGLTYDFDIDGVGRNILLNRSLRGIKDTAPFKWSGLNPTLARQCGMRFAMVLTRADPFPEPKLQALVTYLNSLPPPHGVKEAGRVAEQDSGSVARGRLVFERKARKNGEPIPPNGRCVTCHAGPHRTNRLPANVGTQRASDSKGEFDVPHLTGIASKAPYLHDGRALSLEEIWTLPGVGDQHGVVTDLNKSELNDLIDFLRTL